MGVSEKIRLAALLLCLFFVALGIHQFYVGKIGTGILMIVLMFTGIGEVWLIVDFIMIIVRAFTDKQGRKVTVW